MRWKLSHIERLVDVNITVFARLEGSFDVKQVRSALSRVQGKHPVLRALVRDGLDGPYYESDCASEIPLRILARDGEDDYRQECQSELTTAFAPDQPQLRVVWLRSERESDLLLTTTHRICDGMSVFTIVQEVLCALYCYEPLEPYEPITVRDQTLRAAYDRWSNLGLIRTVLRPFGGGAVVSRSIPQPFCPSEYETARSLRLD